MGSQAERTRHKAAAGGPSKVADCGAGRAVQQLANPAAPHSRIDRPGGMAGELNRLRNPGLQQGGNKASNL